MLLIMVNDNKNTHDEPYNNHIKEHKNNRKKKKKKMGNKIKFIEPPIDKIKKYEDFIDLIFSIQDLYYYNPKAFELMIFSLENFIKIYEYILEDPTLTNHLYYLADKNMHNILNNLHSIIHSLPDDKKIIYKFHTSLKLMEELLNDYINKIYQIHIKQTDIDINSKIINTGPKEINFYENYNFDFY